MSVLGCFCVPCDRRPLRIYSLRAGESTGFVGLEDQAAHHVEVPVDGPRRGRRRPGADLENENLAAGMPDHVDQLVEDQGHCAPSMGLGR